MPDCFACVNAAFDISQPVSSSIHRRACGATVSRPVPVDGCDAVTLESPPLHPGHLVADPPPSLMAAGRTFRVSADDDDGLAGEATVARVVVDVRQLCHRAPVGDVQGQPAAVNAGDEVLQVGGVRADPHARCAH